jgi:hypothetical protein
MIKGNPSGWEQDNTSKEEGKMGWDGSLDLGRENDFALGHGEDS